MRLKRMMTAALLVAAAAVPALAQMGGEETESARTVDLTLKYEQNQQITEEKEKSSHTKVEGSGMVFQQEWVSSTGTKVTEILSVDENGKITKARIKWTEGKRTTEAEQMGQPGEPVEMDSDLKGTSILYTWNAETEEYDSELEEGDAGIGAVEDKLEDTNPWVNPFVPNREVKVGETWDADQDALEEMFGGNDDIKVKEISGTCTAEEVLEEEGVEYLKVSFSVESKGEIQDEKIDNPEMTMTTTGHYLWNIAESRVDKVELENEGSFEAETAGPGGNKMNLTVSISGEEAFENSYGTVEEGGEEDDAEEGGMDG